MSRWDLCEPAAESFPGLGPGDAAPGPEQITRAFAARAGAAAGNVATARVQGTFPGDFFRYRDVVVRDAPVETGNLGGVFPDNFRNLRILRPETLRSGPAAGAYVELRGNRWLVVKSRLFGSVIPSALICRCSGVLITPAGARVPIAWGSLTSREGSITVQPRVDGVQVPDVLCQRNRQTESLEEGCRVQLVAGGGGEDDFLLRGLNRYGTTAPEGGESRLLSFSLERPLLEPVIGGVLLPVG